MAEEPPVSLLPAGPLALPGAAPASSARWVAEAPAPVRPDVPVPVALAEPGAVVFRTSRAAAEPAAARPGEPQPEAAPQDAAASGASMDGPRRATAERVDGAAAVEPPALLPEVPRVELASAQLAEAEPWLDVAVPWALAPRARGLPLVVAAVRRPLGLGQPVVRR